VRVFTGLLSQVRQGGKWRRTQRASALFVVLSAVVSLEVIGTPEGREGERLSRVGPSVKTGVTANTPSRTRR
jgi:hypothetical protein